MSNMDKIWEKYLSDPETQREYIKESERLEAAHLLHELRLSEGLTQKELAEKSGRQQSTIARIESGQTSISFDTFIDILASIGKRVKITIEG